ncbi:hypothetical protein SAMN05421856_105257 [Chryseobacterium taichungense]|uniref:Uncharacterized protein n=1 Tax=Chryseobacterium taichungense TaxID=295069 RepID=A0A1H8AEL0_9FLAO|nr:hypothetical protein [Chryseobacterium taichungense]SEM68278.1 hypothetical protein SAMN05421856_105257 [Chryseobacterium taichungense]
MIILNGQIKNKFSITILSIMLCMQSCNAQEQKITKFFNDKKKILYNDCIKESEIDKIKKKDENKEVIELMINGCKDRVIIFDNFIDGTSTLLTSLPNKENDCIIFNWKKYDSYIPAPTVSLLQTNKTQVVEFTYYDEVRNTYDITMRKKVYEDKEGKFKNELQFIQGTLNGEKMDDNIARYSRNDYYIIKRIKGKYFFYTIINGKLELVQ